MTNIATLTGPSAWNGKDMIKSKRWVRDLKPVEIDDLEKALKAVEQRGIAWRDITRETFVLPHFENLVAEVREELENGSGMVKLRGVPVERYSEDQIRAMYFGLGSVIGTPVYQNRRGELMRAIRDEGGDVGKRYGQIDSMKMQDGKTFLSSYARTLTNGALRFHTDRTDVVVLLCVRQAAKGGVSTICSSVEVMNEMVKRRPDLAKVLYEPVWRSRHGEESDRPDDVYPLPVFGVRDGKFTSHFSLTYIEASQAAANVPRTTAALKEALDMLLSLSNELAFEMTLDPGDIQFLNSHVTYHGRTPFEDDRDAGRDRLLLRLWLSMPNNRALPMDHAVLWRNIDAGKVRGGIAQSGE